MGKHNGWLKSRKRHQILIAKIQRIAGGSLIAALIVGPLIYFSVVAMPLEMRDDNGRKHPQGAMYDAAATPEIDIAATPELRISTTPIPLPEEDPKLAKILKKSEKKDLKLEPSLVKFEKTREEALESAGRDLSETEEVKFESFFGKQDIQIKKIKIGKDLPQAESVHDPLLDSPAPEITIPQLTSEETNKNRENDILVIDNLTLEDGPTKVSNKDDAKKVADKALQRFLRSEFKSTEFRIFKDTSILNKNKKPYQFVLSTIKHNNGKWYITYQQYSNALPVFDGNLKLIFTDKKKLIAISDNIKRNLPDESEFVIGKAVVEENVKEIFEWDDSIDEIGFIDKGYYKGQPAYKANTNAHDPLGEWEIFVDGVEGNIEDLTTNIRLQDSPSTPQPDYSPTPQPSPSSTQEPEIEILDALFSQILGTIYPKTPDDELIIEPLSNSYAYIDTTQHETDYQGYFENENMEWYSTFLDGPNVTIHDNDATSNVEIVNQTPEAPFTWDENSASLAAINSFYHTNKIHDYFVNNHGYEVEKNIPLTVNSTLVDAYIDGCGAWFNNTEKTIEMGRGGTDSCPAELNYALGSDMVYHEYTHFIVEDVTHLPNILGAESAAMGEAFADYFASTINDDPMWGDVISPARRRNLINTLNYNTDMTGESHHDGMILSGALWDLRIEIGQEATDALVFNTLFQDRYHYETFMYGMIIEDDDNDDFSDGTPHLAEIITAFDNHGIGPGIANFDGLPLTPEAWAELLGEDPPEGEEDPIIMGLSGDCDGGSGALNVANGNTCTITGGTYNYTSGAIYGTLTIQSSATVNFSSSVNVYDGGILTVQNTGTLDVNSNLFVDSGADLIVDAGGNLDTNYLYAGDADGTPLGGDITVNGDLDVIFNFYLFDGGVLSVGSTGSVTSNYFHIGDYSDGVPMGGHVENSGDIDVASYTYLMENTGGTAEGDFDNNSGAYFQTSRLYMGYGTNYDGGDYANYNGGYTDVQNYLYIYDDAYYYNGANYVAGVEGTVANYIRVWDGGSLYNAGSSEVYQDYSSGYFIMNDDSLVNNYGTLDINGYLSLDQTTNITLARRPELNNYGTVQVASYASLTDYSRFLNGSSAYSATLDIEDDLRMYDQSTFENSVAGAYTGNVYVYDDLYMEDNAQFHNYATVILDDGGTSTGEIYLTGSPDFYNYESDAVLRSDDVNATSKGLARLYWTSSIVNYGTFDVHELKIGDQGTNTQGGTLTNESGGSVTISTYGTTVTSTPTASVYDGKIENKSGAASFYSYGLMTLEGPSGTALGEFIQSDNSSYVGSIDVLNYGFLDVNTGGVLRIYGNNDSLNGELDLPYSNSVVDNDGSIYVYDTFSMQNDADVDTNGLFSVTATASMSNTSNFRSNSGNTYFYGGLSMYDSADLDNAASTNITIGNSGTESLLMRSATRVDNNGTITIYDDLLMSNEVSGATATYNNNSGATTNITGTTTNKAMIYNSCSIVNAGTFNVDYAAASSTDGVLEVFETANVTNSNAFNASRVLLGNGVSYGGTIDNNSGGTFQVSSNTSAIDVYRGYLTNATGATKLDATGNGLIKMYGVSGDPGRFYDYSTSEGRFLLDPFGQMYIYSTGDHTASTGTILEDGSSNNGLLTIFANGTISCTTCDIGNDLYDPGRVVNYGTFTGTTLNIHEDATAADTDYELANYGSGFTNFATINLGSATENGGEIYNSAGDGIVYGTDGSNEGIRGNTNVYSTGNIYNGGTRTGTVNNSNAEYNHELTPASGTGLYVNSRIDNYGYFGGASISTDDTVGGPKIFSNANTGKVTATAIGVSNSGVFNNGDISANNASVNSSAYIVLRGTGVYNNYGDTITSQLFIGHSTYEGGTLDLEDGGDFSVTDTGTSAAFLYYDGTINSKSGHNTFDVAGRLNIYSVSNNATLNVNSGTGKPTFGELYVSEKGIVNANQSVEIDDSGGNTGDLYITGSTAPDGGKVIVGGVVPIPIFMVDGATTVAAYGTLENNSLSGGAPYTGFYAHDLVTVEANGTIISDNTSDFKFLNGITSAGTVEMDDNVYTTDNSTSGYSIEVTGGTFTTGLSSNTGTTSGGEVMISGGTFNTYNDSSFDDFDVTGAGAIANFEHSTSSCNTDIHGYFDITSGATAEINCGNTNDAVLVRSGSPGGNTQVEGTLIINTNLETETMVVGDGVSTSGLVTHDLTDDLPSSDPTKTFVLKVTDKLTVNSNGSMDVSEKSEVTESGGGNPHGGTYGGQGQDDDASPILEFGNPNSKIVNWGRKGKSSLGDAFGGKGGGIMNIEADILDLKTGGLIQANGGDFLDGGGSGGGINLVISDELTEGGNIYAIGGDSTGSLPSYDDSAGGGGRIYISYYDKSSAGTYGAYTGTVLATGGSGANNGYYAGTGTIFYLWTDPWFNQRRGTIIIDGGGSTRNIDIDNDGIANEIPDDYTNLKNGSGPSGLISDTDSLQAISKGLVVMRSWVDLNPPFATHAAPLQQCMEHDSGDVIGYIEYNSEHASDKKTIADCIFAPDPPNTLYANNSVTGAQSGLASDKSNNPTVDDNTPAFSSIYTDAELDNSDPVVEDTDGAGRYQLQIAPTMADLWNDTTGNYICNLDSQSVPSAPLADDTRIVDIVTNSTTCSFSANTTYYWRMRYEDVDTTLKTWGLWSQTGQFDVGDYTEISNNCSDSIDIKDTNAGGLGGVGTSIQNYDADRYGNDSCGITITSSAAGWQVLYGMSSGETDFEDASSHAWSPIDNSGGDCSIDTTGNTEEEEYGFNLDNASAGLTGKIQQDANCSTAYYTSTSDYFNIEANGSENTIIKDLAASITNATFDLVLHANLDRFTYKGTYSLDTNVTITTTP